MKTFKQYHGYYKLGRWKYLDPRIKFSIIGEIDDEYVVFHHDTMVFGSVMIKDVTLVGTADDVNFQRAYCINKKNVYHSVSNFKTEIQAVVTKICNNDPDFTIS